MSISLQTKRRSALIPTLLLALLFGGPTRCLASWDYGNGRHGSFLLTTNATIEQLYQTVRLPSDPAQYNPADTNAIPNFQTLIITNGATLTADPWNGSAGGWIALKVEATLAVASGSMISANGKGYRGGGLTYGSQFPVGIQGESYAGSQAASSSPNYGGGGGGFVEGYNSFGQIFYGSAGGGGYGSSGAGGITYLNNGTTGGATGGQTYGTPTLIPVYLGSGGGGSANNSAGGGVGGGAIILSVGYLQVSGQIQANGNSSSSGGSGSGGSILLQTASATLGGNNISALGGGSGYGSGGVGRIAIYYAESYSGTSSPAVYTFLDTNSDNVTVITNQPVTQTNFLAADVTFTVGVDGLPALMFQWNFNSVPILGATNQSLFLDNIALTNTGTYSVTISNAVMTVVSSNAFLKVLDTAIPLRDGIPNWWKLQYDFSVTDATLATNHPSGDKLSYLQKYLYGLNPLTLDTDGDGLTDYDEIFIYHTNPLLANTAGDGIPDAWKIQYGLDPSVNIANIQVGATGITYLQLYQYDTNNPNSQLDPRNPFFAPGTSIYEAVNGGQHTNRFYYDREDRLAGAEYSRGISIAYQYDGNGNLLRQTVLSRASETNGLPVLWLWLNGLTNQPGIAYEDSSGNGWDNYQEWLAGADPNNSQSVPSLLNNPGTNIASLTLPFTPSNFVGAAGYLDGLPGDEIVVGADGNPETNINSVLILTQTATNWSTQQVMVGPLGITSIAVGQPTNRPAPAIYVGLRQTGGTGAIWELIQTNGHWQTNVLAVSTNEAAFVLGVRAADVLGSFATNGLDGALFSLAYSAGAWGQTSVSTNSSHRGLGTHGRILAQNDEDSSLRLVDAGGIEVISGPVFTNQWLIPEPPATNRFSWRGLSLAVGFPRPNQTNSTSVFYAFADDQNHSGVLDAGDAFALAEYMVSGNTWTTKTLFQVPITSDNVAQSFSLAAVNFTGTGNDILFTGEPDGRVYSWTATNSASPLQRQLFSDAYAGMAWQAMCGVQMPAFGEGLIGLEVNSTNQNTCNVIFWSPRAVLPTPQPSLIETAPDAITISADNPLGAMATMTVRLWSAEGDSSTPFLQYQVFGSTNWQNATLTMLDGAPYSPATRVSALPTGANHTLVWNILADLGSVSTNITVRARAMDFLLLGDWSVPVPYQVNTLPPFQINSGSTNLQMTTNGFQIQISGLNGAGPVIIYASTNLINWIPIFTNPPSMGSFPFIDPAATNLPRRFYRASEQ